MSSALWMQQAAFSPDGRWIARVAAEGNAQRLYVQPLAGSPYSAGAEPAAD